MDRREFLRKMGKAGAYSLTPAMLKGQQQAVPDPQKPADAPLIPEIPLEALPLQARPLPQPLFPLDYVTFDIERMARTLMDGRHEGLKLTAYPDPGNRQPDWSAGDGLILAPVPDRLKDLPKPFPFEGREYKDYDPRAVWINAGLPADVFDAGLDRFHQRMDKWHGDKMSPKAINKKFLKAIANGTFGQDITQGMANTIACEEVKIAASNSPFFCPKVYRRMSESQQEAMAHLVYQWGPRLMELDGFIHTINTPPDLNGVTELSPEFMHSVQESLVHEAKFFRTYKTRAIAVIAMFDPEYDYHHPKIAEDRVREMAHLRPAHKHTDVLLAENKTSRHSRRKTAAALADSQVAQLEKPDESHTENTRRRHAHRKSHHVVG